MVNTQQKKKLPEELVFLINRLELSFSPQYTTKQIQEFLNHESYFIFLLFLKNQQNSTIPLIKSSDFFKQNPELLQKPQFQQCIGYILYQKIPSEHIIELHKIIIDPLYRNQNFGTIFLKKTIRYIKKLKHYHKILLEVSENNIQAIEFYKKLGFKILRIRKKYYNQNENALIMSIEW